MLAERYFPLESKRYRSISRVFNRLNPSFFTGLALLYSIWAIFLSGSSVSYRVLTDNHYWYWSSFNLITTFSLILIGFIEIKYLEQSKLLSSKVIIDAITIIGSADVNYKQSKNKRLHVELALMKMCSLTSSTEKKKPLISP